MKTFFFKTYRKFLIPSFIFFTISGITLLIFPKDQIHLSVNQFHSYLSDRLFVFLTFLGSGTAALLSVVILLFVNFRFALYLLSSYALSSLVVQVLKRMVFSDMVRPVLYFANEHELYLVPGVNMNLYHSFPSGHSATAFALCFCLTIFFLLKAKKDYGIYFGILAVFIAFSRVYLSQHFLLDIFFGSLIGLLTAFLLYKPFIRPEKKWLDSSLLDRNRKK